MKKKFLSLMMAAAVVATTSVSAFAATNTQTVTGLDTEDKKTEVRITGEVLSETGERPAGTFNVTVPTAAAFTVSKESGVISVPINIQNNGTQDIDVYADEFRDSTKAPGEGITVVKEDAAKTENRTYVSLRVEGTADTAYLKTENSDDQKGIYKDSALENPASTGIKLTNIEQGRSKEITLKGTSGTNGAVSNAVSDNFTLTLKIKKAPKQH